MAKTLLQSLESFRKRLRFCVFAVLSFIFIIAPTSTVFSETKQITNDIVSFLGIQNDAYKAISSGVISLERACFSDLQNDNFDENINQLKKVIELKRENDLNNLKDIQGFITRIITNSDSLVSQNCSLFDLLIQNTQSASACAKSKVLKNTSDNVLSQILEQKQISEKMHEAFNRLLRLEAKQCVSKGFTLNIYSSYQDLISNSVGNANSFYETKLQPLKTQVQKIQNNE